MGMGVVEFAIIAFMFSSSGGYGVPVGIAPGFEDPYLHQIAPDDCLMYASWSGTTELDTGNPTEKLLAQEQIQTFLNKLRTQCELAGKKVEGLSESEKAYREMVTTLPVLALNQPCCFYIDGLQWKDDRDAPIFSGAFVIRLGDEKERVKQIVEAMVDVPDLAEYPKFGGLGDFMLGYAWSSVQNRKFEVQGDYLVFAFGGSGMEAATEKVTEYAKAGEPQWLKELKEELPVARRSSVSMFNVKMVNDLLATANDNEIFRGLKGIGLQSVERISWVTGLDGSGFVGRASIQCDELEGLMKVVDLPPLEPDNLTGVGNRDFIFATKLSAEELYSIVEDIAANVSEKDRFDSMIAEFEAFSGISLKDDLIEDLDEYFYVYGDFDLARFDKNWMLGVGIRDAMSFSETLANFNRRISEVIEESETLEYSVEEFEGIEIHSVKDTRNAFGWFQNPNWARVDSQLLISFSSSTIKNHITKMKESPFVDSAGGKRLWQFAKDQEIAGPIAVMNIDWKKILKLIEPFLAGADDFEVIPELEIRFGDLPDIDTLVNGIEPSITGVYRTPKGFQMYQQQVQPGGSPVATLAYSALASFLFFELDEER